MHAFERESSAITGSISWIMMSLLHPYVSTIVRHRVDHGELINDQRYSSTEQSRKIGAEVDPVGMLVYGAWLSSGRFNWGRRYEVRCAGRGLVSLVAYHARVLGENFGKQQHRSSPPWCSSTSTHAGRRKFTLFVMGL